MKWISTLLLVLALTSVQAQHDAAFRLYNSKGKKVSYKKMVDELLKADVVLFGELHNNPIAHWLQLKVSKSLLERSPIIMGAEMIESDNQAALDRYLSGEIDQAGLDSLARLWPNYKTDYKPLVDLAKREGFRFIATNVPRRYARMVYQGGFEALDTLSAEEKSWIAPLPVPYDASLSQYVAMLEMMGGHGGENFPKAQAIKDATMAHFTVANHSSGSIFIHFNGSFHSNYYEGIHWYLDQYRPGLKIVTINTLMASDINRIDRSAFETADFIIAVEEEMTSTH
jgi:uncharacterized iron-regulated protein